MRNARTDKIHKPMREALRAIGCRCADCYRHGDGFPDMFVFDPVSGRAWLVEIKSGKGTLTPAEERLFADFEGCEILTVWRGIDEALTTVQEARV